MEYLANLAYGFMWSLHVGMCKGLSIEIVIYLGLIQPLHFIEDCNITEPGKTYRARLYYSPQWNEAVELDPGQQLFDAQGFCQYKDLKFIIKWKKSA